MVLIKSISFSFIIAIIAVLIYLYGQSINQTIVISTKFGDLKGFKAISRGGRRFNSFRSIPYAKPPVGKLRFKPSTEYGPWTGIQDGTVAIPICLQADLIFKKLRGQEDCLILNVYTPNIPEKGDGDHELLPVMVFFHGGHWMTGGTDLYGPQYFLDEDVVLVTVNYRLGALGFLNTEDDHASGNMGLKDQVLALKWVQATIKSFGGNPNLVTIFGESAGGAITDLHTLSPMSKGLFHRSISQSGSSLCPWTISTNTKAAAQTLGIKLNCSIESTQKLFECLHEVDGWKIVETHQECFDTFHSAESIFGPSIEKHVKNKGSTFLTESPLKILQEKRSLNAVPHLLGVTSEDGCYRSAAILDNQSKIQELLQDWKNIFPKVFVYDPKNNQGVGEKILKHYFGVSNISPELFSKTNYKKLTAAFSDRYFLKCTRDSALLHAAAAKPESPVYLYWMNYQSSSFGFGHGIAAGSAGNQNVPVLVNVGFEFVRKWLYDLMGWETFNYGVCHADDMLYLFDTIPMLTISTSSPHYEFSRALIKLWVKFAKDGNPGPFKGVEWEQVNPNSSITSLMALNKHPAMIKETFSCGSKFWNSLNLSN